MVMPVCMRWRYRAPTCMRAVISRRGWCFGTNIAQWNGSSWSALDREFPVRALADTDLMFMRCSVGQHTLCGRHVHDGGRSAASYIAQWNGSSWSALGSGISGPVKIATITTLLALMRWRWRAPTCMRAAGSRWRAAFRPTTSRDGTEALGRLWDRA